MTRRCRMSRMLTKLRSETGAPLLVQTSGFPGPWKGRRINYSLQSQLHIIADHGISFPSKVMKAISSDICSLSYMIVNMQLCRSYTTLPAHMQRDGSTRHCQLVSVKVCLQRTNVKEPSLHLVAVKLHTHPTLRLQIYNCLWP